MEAAKVNRYNKQGKTDRRRKQELKKKREERKKMQSNPAGLSIGDEYYRRVIDVTSELACCWYNSLKM